MRRLLLVTCLLLTGCSFSGGNRSGEVARGAVCRDQGIIGISVGNVPGPGACGISSAVKVYEISGVRLSQPATLECGTAKTLKRWIDKDLKRITKRRGGGVESLQVAAHYACRTRNSQKGARLSEHAKGKAIDISAIHLKNGSTISVEDDWGRGRKGRILRKLHKSACGPFGTVLGPKADRFHRDHFHFDTARHRGGPYCR